MSLTDNMVEALRLTRSGDLVGATELLLYGGSAPRTGSGARASEPDTIDLTATRSTHKPTSKARTGATASARAPAKIIKSQTGKAAEPAASAKPHAAAQAGAAAKIAAALRKAAAVAAKAAASATATAASGKAAAPAARAHAARPPGHASAHDAPGSFRAHSYAGEAGDIGYKLYTPRGAAPGMPLVVMLHGCTQSPDDFAAGTAMNALADELGFFVAYPGQTHSRHPTKCWNWYRTGDQQRGRGEPALVAGLTRELIGDHAVDPARVYAAGLSAGGAATAILASAYPDLYAAVGIHSGLACGAAHDTSSALTAMKQGGGKTRRKPHRFVPVITFHGDRDSTVAEINAREIVAAATRDIGVALTTTTETGGSPGGRSWTRALSRDAAGTLLIEQWTVAGAGHAWSGGSPAGSYTDPAGPDASRAMLHFFLER